MKIRVFNSLGCCNIKRDIRTLCKTKRLDSCPAHDSHCWHILFPFPVLSQAFQVYLFLLCNLAWSHEDNAIAYALSIAQRKLFHGFPWFNYIRALLEHHFPALMCVRWSLGIKIKSRSWFNRFECIPRRFCISNRPWCCGSLGHTLSNKQLGN